MPNLDLPFGSEFSPSQINLPEVLEMIAAFEGQTAAFDEEIYKKYFPAGRGEDPTQKRKRAKNVRLALRSYGITEREFKFTEFGKRLYSLRESEELYAELGRHILLNLNGLIVVQSVQDIQASGEDVTLLGIYAELKKQNLNVSSSGTHVSMMRLWLEKAGVFTSGYTVNEARLNELTGVTEEELEALAGLNAEQKAFIRTLANLDGNGPFNSAEVRELAKATYGVNYNEKSLPNEVLYPLQDAGLIVVRKATGGQGAKGSLVYPTEKLKVEVLEPLFEQLAKRIGPKLRQYVRKPFAEVVRELSHTNKNVRGLALEALAIKLMRIIALDYVATRLRGNVTGGAEVDVIFESSRLVFSRWQVQCKNQSHPVALEDVAKEVGLTHMLKSNVIVIVSTNRIGPQARRYANKIMSDSNLCIVMIDGADIKAVVQKPSEIINILEREAKAAMRIKTLEMS